MFVAPLRTGVAAVVGDRRCVDVLRRVGVARDEPLVGLEEDARAVARRTREECEEVAVAAQRGRWTGTSSRRPRAHICRGRCRWHGRTRFVAVSKKTRVPVCDIPLKVGGEGGIGVQRPGRDQRRGATLALVDVLHAVRVLGHQPLGGVEEDPRPVRGGPLEGREEGAVPAGGPGRDQRRGAARALIDIGRSVGVGPGQRAPAYRRTPASRLRRRR